MRDTYEGPPSTWYDPPEVHCRMDCNCELCHIWHDEKGIEAWDGVAECCTEQIDAEIEKGLRCALHRLNEENGCPLCGGDL